MSPLGSTHVVPPSPPNERGESVLPLPRGKDPYRLVVQMIALKRRIDRRKFDWRADPVNLTNILLAKGYEYVPNWPDKISEIAQRWSNPAQLQEDSLDQDQATLTELSEAIQAYLDQKPYVADPMATPEPDPCKIF